MDEKHNYDNRHGLFNFTGSILIDEEMLKELNMSSKEFCDILKHNKLKEGKHYIDLRKDRKKKRLRNIFRRKKKDI